jgi:hypothetical protein
MVQGSEFTVQGLGFVYRWALCANAHARCVYKWALCALTGMPGGSVLEVKGGENAIVVAPEFEAFATALWLVKHMWVIEKSRAAAFANTAAESATIASIVTACCGQEAHGDVARTYLWAFARTYLWLVRYSEVSLRLLGTWRAHICGRSGSCSVSGRCG